MKNVIFRLQVLTTKLTSSVNRVTDVGKEGEGGREGGRLPRSTARNF